MSLISEKMSDTLNSLIGDFFKINRMLDRGMSVLAIKFKLLNTSDFVHQKLAHIYIGDKFADAIGDYKMLRDCDVIYPATPIGDEDYNLPLDLFKSLYINNIKLEDNIKDAIDEAKEEGDESTKKFLKGILKDLTEYTEISKNLIDIYAPCGDDLFKMILIDANIDKLIK